MQSSSYLARPDDHLLQFALGACSMGGTYLSTVELSLSKRMTKTLIQPVLKQASVENCFKNADIKYRSVPVGHAEHPVFPNKASLREGLNSTDKRRQLRSILPDINFDWRETLAQWGFVTNAELFLLKMQDFGPLSLNYDPNANGGAGGAKDPRLDFPIPITKGRKRESQDSERKVDGNGGRFDARVEVACKDCYTSYPSAAYAPSFHPLSLSLQRRRFFRPENLNLVHLVWAPTGQFRLLGGWSPASLDSLPVLLVTYIFEHMLQLRASLLDSGRKTVFETAPVDVDFRASGVPFWIDLSGRLQARTTLDLIAEFTISAGIVFVALSCSNVLYSFTCSKAKGLGLPTPQGLNMKQPTDGALGIPIMKASKGKEG
eukprot:1159765-Pelagomonas_calceolata.AAC.2